MWKVIDFSKLDKSSPLMEPGPLTISISETGAVKNYGISFFDGAGNETGRKRFATPDEVSDFLNRLERAGYRVSIIQDPDDPEHDIGDRWSKAPADMSGTT